MLHRLERSNNWYIGEGALPMMICAYSLRHYFPGIPDEVEVEFAAKMEGDDYIVLENIGSSFRSVRVCRPDRSIYSMETCVLTMRKALQAFGTKSVCMAVYYQ